MTKNYVIDTNVLIHDYHSFSKILNGNNVFLPYIVLEELDKLKTKNDQVGASARNAIRLIEQELIKENEHFAILDTDDYNCIADDKIVRATLKLKENGLNPILVSNDICLRTKARSKGILTEEYNDDKVDVSDLYTGISKVKVNGDIVEQVYEEGFIEVTTSEYYPNESVVLINKDNPKNKAITIFKDGKLILIDNRIAPFGLKCANLEQQIATNYLLDPDIKMLTLTGKAGCGKTLLALAGALECVLERQMYNKVTVARPIMPFQKDIGYLPGTEKEKISPWFAPMVDNLEFLFQFADQPNSKKKGKLNPFEELQEHGVMEMCALTFIRGRSIPKQFVIIDECQNISGQETKAILTRAGADTKIILTGDIEQIDSPYLSSDNNGLSYCVDKFKNQSIAAHMTFSKCERSELAEISSQIL